MAISFRMNKNLMRKVMLTKKCTNCKGLVNPDIKQKTEAAVRKCSAK